MKYSGAEIVSKILKEQNISCVFGYPGGQILPIYDALRRAKGIRHVLTAHEQGAVHAADGYARASGGVGVVLATSGPGATNLITGLAAAYADSVPLVAITGNVPRSLVGRDGFQEVDTWGLSLPVTKHSFLIKEPEQLAPVLRLAFRIAMSGRKGPVLVDVPKDIQMETIEYLPSPPQQPREAPTVSEEELDRAAELLSGVHRPYVYCGGGVVQSDAGKLLEALAERIDAPIGCSMMGLSAVPDSNPRKLGMQGMHGRFASSAAMEEADLLIALGVRFSDRAHTVQGKRILHIDVDAAEIGKNVATYFGLCGDLNEILTRLLPRLPQQSHPTWHTRLHSLRLEEAKRMEEYQAPMHPAGLIQRTSEQFADAVFVTDVGQHQMWAAQCCKLTRPRTFLTSGGLGAMGYGMGAAIGAALAVSRRTVLFTGDGSFGMNCTELATAVSERLPITIVLLNNQSLGMIRQWQDAAYDGKRFACDLNRKTDYRMLAEAFGAKACVAEDEASFARALEQAAKTRRPFLIDCRISGEWNVIPMLLRPDEPVGLPRKKRRKSKSDSEKQH
ncbi:MAG: biosynthetic-type acetolactate synthase large subunit [Oscillospiraceae bacterium]|nr:biosynthetic-type acetolactate synthase large subunit [Oscillospiraceae bacterium]